MRTDMSENFNDQDIKEALEMSLISDEPSTELMRKLQVMASKTQPKRARWRYSLALAGGVAVVGLGFVMTLAPAKAQAKSYDKVVDAVDKVKAFELQIDADNDKKLEILAADGKFTMRADKGALMQMDGGTFRIYDPQKNSILEMKLGGMVDEKMIAQQMQSGMADAFDHMDLKGELRKFEQKYGKDNIKISPVTQEDGHSVYHVTMTDPEKGGTVEMKVDAETDLPSEIDVHRGPNSPAREQDAVIRVHFGAQIDPKLLDAEFPANAKKVELDLGKMISGLSGLGDKAGKQFGGQMQQWGEQFGKQMEQFGKQFGDQMDKAGNQMSDQMDKMGDPSDKAPNPPAPKAD